MCPAVCPYSLEAGIQENTSRSLFTAGSRSLTDFISALILSNICFLPFSENKNALVCITDEGDISITVPLRFGAYTPFMSLTQTTRAEILISLTFPLPTRIKIRTAALHRKSVCRLSPYTALCETFSRLLLPYTVFALILHYMFSVS